MTDATGNKAPLTEDNREHTPAYGELAKRVLADEPQIVQAGGAIAIVPGGFTQALAERLTLAQAVLDLSEREERFNTVFGVICEVAGIKNAVSTDDLEAWVRQAKARIAELEETEAALRVRIHYNVERIGELEAELVDKPASRTAHAIETALTERDRYRAALERLRRMKNANPDDIQGAAWRNGYNDAVLEVRRIARTALEEK